MADVKYSRRFSKSRSFAAVGKQNSNASNAVNAAEEGDDVELETESQTKIDINTLKNEILTDGMQVRATGYNISCMPCLRI